MTAQPFHTDVFLPDDTVRFAIEEERLGDGSIAHNVRLQLRDMRIVLHAVTERDAVELAEKLVAAINDHTVEEAARFY